MIVSKYIASLALLAVVGSYGPPVNAGPGGPPGPLRVLRQAAPGASLRAMPRAISIDMSRPLVPAGNQREPIAEAAPVPGIYRSFLVWRQRYAHLALCNMTLCNGSCLEFGDGCLVCAQEPVLPLLLGTDRDGCTDPFVFVTNAPAESPDGSLPGAVPSPSHNASQKREQCCP
ncbi:MAG: hypothetical protein KGS72_02560 [Cyanobacteria bacterium REEB67]|nr:hypothetical protein [Cyanobacteria bacterium REEB67]